MKPLLDIVLFLVWVSVYLVAISWITRYRKAKVYALGPTERTDYRADRDIALRLAVFTLGILLLFLAYIATRVVSHII